MIAAMVLPMLGSHGSWISLTAVAALLAIAAVAAVRVRRGADCATTMVDALAMAGVMLASLLTAPMSGGHAHAAISPDAAGIAVVVVWAAARLGMRMSDAGKRAPLVGWAAGAAASGAMLVGMIVLDALGTHP